MLEQLTSQAGSIHGKLLTMYQRKDDRQAAPNGSASRALPDDDVIRGIVALVPSASHPVMHPALKRSITFYFRPMITP